MLELERQGREHAPKLADMLEAYAAELGSRPYADAPGEGDVAPDFELPDETGAPVRLSALLAEGPAVVAFYRGEWCPYCNLQLRAYQGILPQLEDHRACLVAISPQIPDRSLSTSERNELGFAVLSDSGNEVARSYGLTFTVDGAVKDMMTRRDGGLPAFNGDDSWKLPVPGTFVIDTNARVALSHVNGNYRRRLEPAAILDALANL